VLGTTLAALISVVCVLLCGSAPWVIGLAVALAITSGQLLRLHPPAGAVALLGVLQSARPGFVLMPVLLGSLLLVLMAVDLNQRSPARSPYPHHWL